MGGSGEGCLVEHAMTELQSAVTLAERILAFLAAKFSSTCRHAVMLGLMESRLRRRAARACRRQSGITRTMCQVAQEWMGSC